MKSLINLRKTIANNETKLSLAKTDKQRASITTRLSKQYERLGIYEQKATVKINKLQAQIDEIKSILSPVEQSAIQVPFTNAVCEKIIIEVEAEEIAQIPIVQAVCQKIIIEVEAEEEEYEYIDTQIDSTDVSDTAVEIPEYALEMIHTCEPEDLPHVRRVLAREYHPDRNVRGAEIMAEINNYIDEMLTRQEESQYIPAQDFQYDEFGVPFEQFSNDDSESEISDRDYDFDNQPITEQMIQQAQKISVYCNYQDMDCSGLSELYECEEMKYFFGLGFAENLESVYAIVRHNLDEVSRKIVSRDLSNPISIEIMQTYWLQYQQEQYKKQLLQHKINHKVQCSNCKSSIREIFARQCASGNHWFCIDGVIEVNGKLEYNTPCKQKVIWLSDCAICEQGFDSNWNSKTSQALDVNLAADRKDNRAVKVKITSKYIELVPHKSQKQLYAEQLENDFNEYQQFMREQQLQQLIEEEVHWEKCETQEEPMELIDFIRQRYTAQ